MRLLALETSTEYCSCALLVNDAVLERRVLAGQRHSELLLGQVADLMAEAGIGFGQLDGVAFGAGPGSFTGLRIACGAAQGLAFGHDLPMLPIVSLLAVAEQGLAAGAGGTVLAAFDARMGELYLAAYRRTEGAWVTLLAPQVAKPDDLPALPDGKVDFGAGSGFAIYAAALLARYAPQHCAATLVPRAREVGMLAAGALARGEAVAAEAAVPLYLRDKVALNRHEQAALRASNQKQRDETAHMEKAALAAVARA